MANARTPMETLCLFARAVVRALATLGYATLCAANAVCAAAIVAHRTMGDCSPVFLAAYLALVYVAYLVFLLLPAVMVGMMCSICSNSNKTHPKEIPSVKDIQEPAPERSMWQMFLISVLTGPIPFVLLAANEALLMDQPPPKGSQREWINSLLRDVGIVGFNTWYCFTYLRMKTWMC